MSRWSLTRWSVALRYVGLVTLLLVQVFGDTTVWLLVALLAILAVSLVADVLVASWARDAARVDNRTEDEIRTGRTAQERVA